VARVNFLDVLLLSGLLLAAIRGFRHGALSQVAAFGGAAAGLVLGAILAPRVAGAVVGEPGLSLALFTLGLLLVLIFIGQGIGFGIGLRLRRAAHGVGAAAVDRTAGIVVGVTGVLLTVWLLAAALTQGPFPAVAQQLRDSQVVGAIDDTLPTAPDVFSRVGNYLDQQGFPQVFAGLAGTTAPPVDPPTDAAVAAAQEAGAAATVQVQARGCGGISSGSGFVTTAGFVVTNAHVIAGGSDVTVRDLDGTTAAVAIHFDPSLDLAVLRAPEVQAPAIAWTPSPVDRGSQGATLGYPGGQRELNVNPASVRGRGTAVGRDIYGRGAAERDILTLSSHVRRGDSGGPYVTSDGVVGGVVFAAAPAEPGTGYALTAERVRPDVEAAIGANAETGTGPCRF
jgi:S1-C subfamily serine protease